MTITASGGDRLDRIFRQRAVTSSINIGQSAVDLKIAACFYDSVTLMDYKDFEPSLESALGPDLEYLVDQGLIVIEPYDKQLAIDSNHKAYEYARAIQSHMAASLFTPAEEKVPVFEVAGNGMARLYAAMAANEIDGQSFVPIVSGRTRLEGYANEINLEGTPLPTALEIEELLPVKTTATEALFNLIPVPAAAVPWQDVLEFRDQQSTGLYAARIRILLERLSKETDRRHAEDMIRSEFATFESKLRVFKKQVALTSFKAVLPWGDFLHGLVKSFALLKPSEVVKPLIETAERDIELMKAEDQIRQDPYYMIEHVRRAFA